MSIRRALLVGINAYPAAPLRGCVNDVLQIRNLLQRYYGFRDEDIRVLLTARRGTGQVWSLVDQYSAQKVGGASLPAPDGGAGVPAAVALGCASYGVSHQKLD